MGKTMKRIFTSVIALIMICTETLPTFAASTKSKDESKVAETVAESFIRETINHHFHTTWNSKTIIAERIPTYAPDDSVNGIIFNLRTAGKVNGYIVLTFINDKAPAILEYGYDGSYKVAGKDIGQIAERRKVYSTGGIQDYYIKNKINCFSSLCDATDSVPLNKMTSIYKINRQRTMHQENLPKDTMRNAQTMYEDVNVSDIFDFSPWSMGQLGNNDNNNCTEIATMNLLRYWEYCRNIKPLFFSDDYQECYSALKQLMRYDPNNGTVAKDAFNGVQEYISDYGLHPIDGTAFEIAGKDIISTEKQWNWMTTNLKNNIPFILNASCINYLGSGHGKLHSFGAVGYQATSTGNYLRVYDETDSSVSHFYNFSAWYYEVSTYWYVRWNG